MEFIAAFIEKGSPEQLKEIDKFINSRLFKLNLAKYSSGKIYNVKHKETGIVAYTGSTIQELPTRWSGHRSFFKSNPKSKWTKYVVDNGGPEAFEIMLVKMFPCRSLKELLNEERRCIDEFKPPCNTNLLTTIKIKKETKKEMPLKMWTCDYDLLFNNADELTEDQRIRILDFMEDCRNRNLVMNLWSESHLDCDTVEDIIENAFEYLTPSDISVVKGVRKFCSLLGLTSTHDYDTLITEETLTANLEPLTTLVNELQGQLKIKPSTSSSTKTKRSKVLKLNLDTILIEFAGTKLLGTPTRLQKGKVRERIYEYRLKRPENYFQDIIDFV